MATDITDGIYQESRTSCRDARAETGQARIAWDEGWGKGWEYDITLGLISFQVTVNKGSIMENSVRAVTLILTPLPPHGVRG